MTTSVPKVDFASALFLGQYHPSRELRPWEEFTTGAPVAVREVPEARTLASSVATQQRAESGLVARSALHGLMDVMEALPQPGDLVLVDQGAYPLAQWACSVAMMRGVRLETFPHHQPPASLPPGRTWFVTDGWCQGCGLPAPLARMQALALETGGRVIVDDSLAFGLLGRRTSGAAFGDGTGTVRWSGLDHGGFVWLASLAKAYGTPITVITGDHTTITRVAHLGSNRLHSSPPSAADLGAGLSALVRNTQVGELRGRLYRLTQWLRRAFTDLGYPPQGLPFPVVGTRISSSLLARRWWRELAADGVQVLVQLPRCHPIPVLSAVVRADHRQVDLDRLVRALAAATRIRSATR